MMKKKDIVEYLVSIDENISVGEIQKLRNLNSKELHKLYYSSKKKDETIEEIVEEIKEEIVPLNLQRILDFVPTIKGKSKGTPEEIELMFNLYNNYYKRNERPNCQICIGNVYQKLINVYNKFKKNK